MFTGRIHSLKSLERSKLTGITHLLRAIPSPTRCHDPAIWLALLVALCIAILPLAFTRAESPGAPVFSDADLEFFENKVRPLLVEHCYECHSANAETLEGGLRLDSRASILAGGDTQEAVVPGHPDQSLLIDAIEYGDLYEMPPANKLPEATVAIFRDWVQRGAPWPEEELKNGPAVPELFDLQKRKSEHWAWQQLLDPPLPEVYDASCVQPLDRFVLAKLEGSGIQPAPAAEPHTLLRRAYFDLIGLPPPREVVVAFEAEPTAEAFSAVIDQLLNSPQFGERWARHWLDLMRYAETRGHEHDYILPNAWQYRDYVIRAFNTDVPYDQFVTEHLAGDLLDPPRMNPEKRFNESILATGFWYLGEWIHSPVDIRKDETDRFDNAIDVFGKTFLGLTVACARCHDHKFDAISQEDYYALAGFLQSSGYRQVRFDTLDHNRSVARQLQELRRSAGAQLAEQEALKRLASSHQMEALLLAATEAVAAGILPAQKNASVGRQVPIALVAANASEEVYLRRLTDIASRRGLSVNTLMPWLAELIKASTNPQHPLHGLASAATNPPSQKAVKLDEPEVETWSFPKRSRVVVDFDNTDVAWLADGPAFSAGPLRRGEVLPSGDGMKAIAGIVDRGHARLFPQLADLQLAGGVEGDPRKLLEDPSEKDDWVERPGRVLRTPTVELRGGKLFYLVRGAAKVQVVIDSHRLLVGPLHFESIMTIDHSEEWGWVEHDLTPYVGHGVHVEFSPNGDWPLEIYMVVEGEEMPSLPLSNEALTVSAALPASDGAEKMARNYAALIVESLTRLAENNLSDSAAHRAVAFWAIRQEQLWPSKRADAISTTLAEYRQQSSELMQKLLRQSSTAPAIWDGVSENERLLIRGNSRTPGQLVERRLLTAIASRNQPVIQDGSGRLELARRLFASDNPLPSRVMANRIWHHLTGRGIVPSLDNFGVLGQEPTHPELLDHLASRFIDHRWSIKAMIREVMLSRTYQMSSRGSAAGDKLDPQNLLLHRMPVRRLQAEAIRDSMLSLAHRLDLQQFGPSVPIHLTDFMNGRGRPEESGPLDGAGRRSIYVSVRRNFLSPMMLAFDAPQPAGPVGRRNVSNVPAQALILLNDPFVLQQARLLAKHLIDAEPDDDRRIERMYVEAFARPPDAREAAAARQFLALQASQHEAIEEDAQREAWADLCHVMFNLKEFIFLN